MNHLFFPSAARARALDQRMKTELVKSLRSVCAQVSAQDRDLGHRLARIETELCPDLDAQDGPIPPPLYTAYYQLVLALYDSAEQIDDRLEQLLSLPRRLPPGSPRITDLSVDGLGSQRLLNLYRFALDTDDRLELAFLPPGQAERERTGRAICRAMRLMNSIDADLAGEFRHLVSQIVLAAPGREPGAIRFDGASSYMLWGALALSVDEEKSDLQMLETLAHESAHSLLFGLTIEEPLVLNDDEELYHSPLRLDPRPMDGIYHATFVSARMHYAMHRASTSGVLDAAQLDECERLLAADRQAFSDGLSVVSRYGKLSPTGASILSAAEAYMMAATRTDRQQSFAELPRP
ncbi:MAG: HEXXH motif-containing putative peptide modification protein [Pseudomonadales bacterium]